MIETIAQILVFLSSIVVSVGITIIIIEKRIRVINDDISEIYLRNFLADIMLYKELDLIWEKVG